MDRTAPTPSGVDGSGGEMLGARGRTTLGGGTRRKRGEAGGSSPG
jgi:hypothetical protein